MFRLVLYLPLSKDESYGTVVFIGIFNYFQVTKTFVPTYTSVSVQGRTTLQDLAPRDGGPLSQQGQQDVRPYMYLPPETQLKRC